MGKQDNNPIYLWSGGINPPHRLIGLGVIFNAREARGHWTHTNSAKDGVQDETMHVVPHGRYIGPTHIEYFGLYTSVYVRSLHMYYNCMHLYIFIGHTYREKEQSV